MPYASYVPGLSSVAHLFATLIPARRRARNRRQRPSAFTLIELLVVVAIIVVLIAILMPALNRAREQAKTSVCLSNLRQQGISYHTYAHEWATWFPLYGFTGGPGASQIARGTWGQGSQPYTLPASAQGRGGRPALTYGTYVTSHKIFYCPKWSGNIPSASTWAGVPTGASNAGIGYISLPGPFCQGWYASKHFGERTSDPISSSLLVDRAYWRNGGWASVPHLGLCILYVDGHASFFSIPAPVGTYGFSTTPGSSPNVYPAWHEP